MDIAILVPVLRRPHRVKPLLESIAEATTVPYRVCFIPNPEDEAEKRAIRQMGGEIVCESDGNYAQKINMAVELTDEPLLLIGADDLNFHPGWFEAAKAKMTDGIGVVGTNDRCNLRTMRGEHSTHSLVARWYAELGTIDEPGKLLCEQYRHEFVDDEMVLTAKHRGAWAHAGDSIVEHLHPMNGKAPMDELYAAQPERMWQGRKLFQRRSHLWT